jgi:antitoxin component YwqK of YwqJK toxin-antitoxin module
MLAYSSLLRFSLFFLALMAACGGPTPSGSGGGGFVPGTGQPPGTPCNPELQADGCYNVGYAQHMRCDPETSQWQLVEACIGGEICVESTNPGPHTAACQLPGTWTPTSGAGDATATSDSSVETDGEASDAGEPTDSGADAGSKPDVPVNPNCPPGPELWNGDGVTYTYQVVDGSHVLQGPYQTSGGPGVPGASGCFEAGKRTGKWLYQYLSGAKLGDETWNNGLLEGPSTTYFEAGGKQATGSWVNGKKTGSFLEYYEDGTKKRQSLWKDGRNAGSDTQWYNDGSKQYQASWDSAGNPLSMVWFLKDGSTAGQTTFKSGNGTVNVKGESGQKVLTGSYVAGKQDGVWSWFFDSGNLQRKFVFASGSGPGIEYVDGDNGKKAKEYSVTEGWLDGPYTEYQSDGVTLALQGSYVDGHRSGTWTSYNAKGKPAASGCYGATVYLHAGECAPEDPQP